MSGVSESAVEFQYNLLLVSMDIDRIFTADQIAVPPELPQIIKDYTKAVLRANPKDLLEFSRDYFQTQLAKANAKPGNFICSVLVLLHSQYSCTFHRGRRY